MALWHTNSMASALTSKPVKLGVSNRKKIQNGLEFVDTDSIVQQRNRNFFLSQWFMINVTIKELFLKYIKSNPEVPVSLGTFLALKHFHVCSATTSCKKHLHTCWSIQALIQCATKQQVDLNSIDSYDAFFDYVTSSCEAESTTYISWKCTPDANKTCEHISDNSNSLKEKILEQDDGKLL